MRVVSTPVHGSPERVVVCGHTEPPRIYQGATLLFLRQLTDEELAVYRLAVADWVARSLSKGESVGEEILAEMTRRRSVAA